MSAYDEGFYRNQRERSLRSARTVLPLVLERVPARSVVDVGCGVGTWLKVASEHGVQDLLGLDGPHVLELQPLVPGTVLRSVDLTRPLSVGRTFDLVLSLEVAEHLPANTAASFIESLCALGPVVLFSAAIPFQGGTAHVNEQWPDYWAALFSRHGFVPIDFLRDRLWSHSGVEPCYAQNSILYVSEDRLARDAGLTAERVRAPGTVRRLVHPELFLAYAQPGAYGVRRSARLLASSLVSAVRRRIEGRKEPG